MVMNWHYIIVTLGYAFIMIKLFTITTQGNYPHMKEPHSQASISKNIYINELRSLDDTLKFPFYKKICVIVAVFSLDDEPLIHKKR